MSYTKGPWEWVKEASPDEDGFILFVDQSSWLKSADGRMVLEYKECGTHECKKSEADAKLIASAPEMIELLKTIASRCVDYDNMQIRTLELSKAIELVERLT